MFTRIIMNLEICEKCENYQGRISDSVLCRYQNIVEYNVIDGDTVISCPKERKERKGRLAG
jgi:hypothetical protein